MTTAVKTQPIQTKAADLTAFDQINSQDGGFRGYCAVFGNVDSGGDVILPGAFREGLKQFIGSGWCAPEHNWSIQSELGVISSAVEDSKGLLITVEFHSTEDAQALRQKIAKRVNMGKSAKMSIGYKAIETLTLYPSQYERELPKYLSAAYLKAGLAEARKHSSIRLLKKIQLFEASLVAMPMNDQADVVAVKSAGVVSAAKPSNWQSEIRLARIRLIQLRTKQLLGKPLTPQEKREWRGIDYRLKAIDRAAFAALKQSRQAKKEQLQRRVQQAKARRNK